MKIYHSIKEIKAPARGSVLAIGIFDGIHKGHRRIIKKLVERSRRAKKKSLILTFYPHPSSVLSCDMSAPLLISLEHRLRLLERMGIDIAVVVKFTSGFSRMKPEKFVRDLLLKKLCMSEMVLGEDFVFGHRSSGTLKLLEELSGKYGFKLTRVSLLKRGKKIVSSTNIRFLITRGKLREASQLLGRPVSILGTVKKGARRGRLLGYPTANIDPHHEAIPPSGVYAVYIYFRGKRYRGLLNIGFRPTFHIEGYPPEPTIEAHMFNFHNMIYGKELEIFFVKRLRGEKRFASNEALKKRIGLDERAARRILGKKLK